MTLMPTPGIPSGTTFNPEQIQHLLLKGLQDPCVDVKVAALKTCVYFLLESQDTRWVTSHGSNWMAPMVQVCYSEIDELNYLGLARDFRHTFSPY
jgi:hypothetical protein